MMVVVLEVLLLYSLHTLIVEMNVVVIFGF